MAITVVQHASATKTFATGSSGTISPAFTSNTTSGNALIACVTLLSIDGAGSIASVNTNGTTENWALAKGTSSTAVFFCYDAIWADPNTGGGQKIINVGLTFSTASADAAGACVDIYEVSGLATSSILDKSASGIGASTTAWTSTATATTTQASEIAFGSLGCTAISTPTVTAPGSPWTEETTLTAASAQTVVHKSGFNILSSTGAITYNGTTSTTLDQYCACVATFLGSGSVSGAATFTGAGTFGAAATVTTGPSASFTGLGSFGAVAETQGRAAFTGTSTFTAGATVGRLTLIGAWTSAGGTDPLLGQTVPMGLYVNQGEFIVNQNGTFFYSGIPASGNLIASIAPTVTTDSFGNTVKPGGLATYSGTATNFIGQAGAFNEINLYTGVSFEGEPLQIINVPNGSGGTQFISGGIFGPAASNPSHDDFVSILLNSANQGGGSTANGGIVYTNSSGAASQIATWDGIGFNTFGDGALSGTLNGVQLESGTNPGSESGSTGAAFGAPPTSGGTVAGSFGGSALTYVTAQETSYNATRTVLIDLISKYNSLISALLTSGVIH